ncbi:GATA transcription factor pannier-like protein [Mycena leptocephala]|nr:GATA transcription factor pannier-like protein [Mycena leptocephala]
MLPCHATYTPLWRRDPRTHELVCNACGLYLLHDQRMSSASRPSSRWTTRPRTTYDGLECSNCGTRKTSTWRRNKAGESVCNACGVYERISGKPRPVGTAK